MTEFLQVYLPICIYILLIILLVVGIILGVRLINVMNKVDEILENVEGKVNSLNGLFGVIDFTTSKISNFNDRFFDLFTGLISKIGKRHKARDEMEDEDYE